MQLAILLPAGFAAGLLNALAGGGSFMTVPLLIFTGLEPTVANATNRLGIWIQSLAGTRKFSNMGYFPKVYSYTAAIPVGLGAISGAYLATIVSDDMFRKYFAFFMVLMTLVTFLKPGTKELKEDVKFTVWATVINSVVYFFIGIYSGFVQAGVGFLMTAACVMSGLDMVRAHAVKLFLNLIAATVSVAIFIYAGKVLFLPAIALGSGMAFGAVTAANISVKVSNTFLKRVVSVAIIIFAILLLVLK
ncbi:sulfite exporter TauE/SafE family protein [Deferribacteres bacterium DY0037]